MSRDARKCTVCGTEYNYCPRCSRYVHLPKWKTMFCSEGCKELWDAASEYRATGAGKARFDALALKVDASGLDAYHPVIAEMVLEVQTAPAPPHGKQAVQKEKKPKQNERYVTA